MQIGCVLCEICAVIEGRLDCRDCDGGASNRPPHGAPTASGGCQSPGNSTANARVCRASNSDPGIALVFAMANVRRGGDVTGRFTSPVLQIHVSIVSSDAASPYSSRSNRSLPRSGATLFGQLLCLVPPLLPSLFCFGLPQCSGPA
jgi:hypothetical protein